MVPLSSIIQTPLARIQTAARQRLAQALDWPDLARAVAMSICQRHEITYPDVWLTDLREFEHPEFRRAPVVAAYGFVLNKVRPDLRDAWPGAIEALRGRVPFPGDRGSFAYSPRELLGIACGLAHLPADPEDHIGWFTNLLVEGFHSSHFNNPTLQIAALIALHHLDPARARSTRPEPPEIASLPIRDLVLIAQLGFAVPADEIVPTPALEAAFNERLANESLGINDAAEAAALMHLARRLLDTFALQGRSASRLDSVLALCRRFHLFAMQLERRHADRPPFSIQDEYDVQDLIHAILALHFDDVRAEEVTPSHAGNSSRVDFYLPDARLMLEVKMTRKSLRQRDIVTQLHDDAARYAARDDVDTLICLVYDPGAFCHNPTALERDVRESARKLSVHAVVCPRGM